MPKANQPVLATIIHLFEKPKKSNCRKMGFVFIPKQKWRTSISEPWL